MNESRPRVTARERYEQLRKIMADRFAEHAQRLRDTLVRVRADQDPFDSDDKRWFSQGEGIPHMRNQLDHLPRQAGRVLLPAIVMLASTCDFAVNTGHQDAAVDFAPNASADNAIDITFKSISEGYTQQDIAKIELRDVNKPQFWDQDLAPIHDTQRVSSNNLYQYHVGILRQELGGESFQDLKKESRNNSSNSREGQFGYLPHHPYEAARMPAGIYPRFDEQVALFHGRDMTLGNMDIQNPEVFTSEVLQHAQSFSSEHAWGDLNDLSMAQWIQVIDNFNVEQVYDYTLASTDVLYDPVVADEVNRMPVDELVHREEGAVCRDFLREQLAAYLVYSEQFGLEDRGLLMLPVARFSDAGHARSLFVMARGKEDLTVVSTDTTNTRDRALEPQDSTADATAVWYGQKIASKEWFGPEEAQAFFSLTAAAPDMYPTTAAIAQREAIIASLKTAELALRIDNDTREFHFQLQRAFNDLILKLNMQSEYEGVLSKPGQMVPLYDLLVSLGKEIDSKHEETALKVFSAYVQKNGLSVEDLKMYRTRLQQINRAPLLATPGVSLEQESIRELRESLGL